MKSQLLLKLATTGDNQVENAPETFKVKKLLIFFPSETDSMKHKWSISSCKNDAMRFRFPSAPDSIDAMRHHHTT